MAFEGKHSHEFSNIVNVRTELAGAVVGFTVLVDLVETTR